VPHSIDLILTLAGGLGAALVAGYITHRLGLSPIVGYLFAGIIVGPNTPGFVADRHLAEQMAEIGVVLLMFGVGLQFHIEELLAVRKIAVPGAVVQSVTATVLGTLAATTWGWTLSSGFVFGIALSVASTVVLVRVLTDNRELHTRTGHIAVGWLVVEDIFTVLVLVLLPALFGDSDSSPTVALGLALLKVAGLVVFIIYVGGRVIPAMLAAIARTQSRELFTLAVLALALGIAVGSAVIFGVSMALGAFLAGLVVGRSDFSVRAASDALPMRDAFAVLFFVSVGMLLDPAHLLREPGAILTALAIVMIGKPLAALLIVKLFRYPLDVGLKVAVALAQIGEFSFIVATLATQLGLLSIEATNTLIATAIVSITVNPLLFAAVAPFERWRAAQRRQAVVAAADTGEAAPNDARAVVVGYGPTGRALTRLLRENHVAPTVIEMNIDTVQALRAEGVDAIFGDASHPDTLAAARVATARGFIVSASGLPDIEETLKSARAQNARAQILVRATYLRDVPRLKAAGADLVISGEAEVALALTAAMLERLGATAEQIDRERARVHAELG
jgi:CPA2 family monovalent cation:H+ antiporter-2